MNRNQLTWVVAAMVVGTMLGYAHGVQTIVRLDVVTPDPNDANAVPGDAGRKGDILLFDASVHD